MGWGGATLGAPASRRPVKSRNRNSPARRQRSQDRIPVKTTQRALVRGNLSFDEAGEKSRPAKQ
jgi:hypothetical protein